MVDLLFILLAPPLYLPCKQEIKLKNIAMKQSKKNIISVLMLSFALLISGITFAQAQRGGKQKPPVPNEKQVIKMVDKLSEDLELSDDQEKEVLALYQDHFAEVEEKTSGNQRPEREEMEALKSSLEKDVKALLNEEQQSKFDDYLEEREQNKPKRR